jgi:hypothetical protein
VVPASASKAKSAWVNPLLQIDPISSAISVEPQPTHIEEPVPAPVAPSSSAKPARSAWDKPLFHVDPIASGSSLEAQPSVNVGSPTTQPSQSDKICGCSLIRSERILSSDMPLDQLLEEAHHMNSLLHSMVASCQLTPHSGLKSTPLTPAAMSVICCAGHTLSHPPAGRVPSLPRVRALMVLNILR